MNFTGPEGSLTFNIPRGYYFGAETAQCLDSDIVEGNIWSGVTLFGVTGSYSPSSSTFATVMASTAPRNIGVVAVPSLANQTTSQQMALSDETSLYGTGDLPVGNGVSYRDIPDQYRDDEGLNGVNCNYAPRPSNICGDSTLPTIAGKIADCASKNPTTSAWNGATQRNGGEGEWKLVTRLAPNKEVWQDQRTKLLWSSYVSSGIVNWCQASGNTQEAPVSFVWSYKTSESVAMIGNVTISAISGGSQSAAEIITITFSSSTTFSVSGSQCGGGGVLSGGLTTAPGSSVTWGRANYCSFTITQGSILFESGDVFKLDSNKGSLYSCVPGAGNQPATPISYCAEGPGFDAAAIGENWNPGAASYMAAKGGLGKYSVPSVRWRLPTISDYRLAEVNGIRFVLPDMGLPGVYRPRRDGSPGHSYAEWSATVLSGGPAWHYTYSSWSGSFSDDGRNGAAPARCVGRW